MKLQSQTVASVWQSCLPQQEMREADWKYRSVEADGWVCTCRLHSHEWCHRIIYISSAKVSHTPITKSHLLRSLLQGSQCSSIAWRYYKPPRLYWSHLISLFLPPWLCDAPWPIKGVASTSLLPALSNEQKVQEQPEFKTGQTTSLSNAMTRRLEPKFLEWDDDWLRNWTAHPTLPLGLWLDDAQVV